jgi:hypothetical protein
LVADLHESAIAHLRRTIVEFVEHYQRKPNQQRLGNGIIAAISPRGMHRNSPSSASWRIPQLALPCGLTDRGSTPHSTELWDIGGSIGCSIDRQ